MISPFLFRFTKDCMSPRRMERDPEYVYDNKTDLVHWMGDSSYPPAILKSGKRPPRTKKGDLEKGDDNKDRRMWH